MVGVINIIGDIGTEVTLQSVIRQVKSQPKAKSFIVNIDSDGGSYFVGFDIYHYLKGLSSKGYKITTIGRSKVCSIATVIFLAGNVRKILDNTMFMVHMPMLATKDGDMKRSDELIADAMELKMLEDEILNFYAQNTSLTKEELSILMAYEDVFLSADELFEFGFTTENKAIEVVAKLNINKMNKKKSLLERIQAMLRSDIVMKTLKTADQEDLVFEGVEDDADIKVGDHAKLDGQPADGRIVLADGRILEFENGELREIITEEYLNEDLDEVEVLEEKLDEVLEVQELIVEVLEDVQEEVEAIEEEVVAKLKNYKAKLQKATNGSSRNYKREPVARKNGTGRLSELSKGIQNLRNRKNK